MAKMCRPTAQLKPGVSVVDKLGYRGVILGRGGLGTMRIRFGDGAIRKRWPEDLMVVNPEVAAHA